MSSNKHKPQKNRIPLLLSVLLFFGFCILSATPQQVPSTYAQGGASGGVSGGGSSLQDRLCKVTNGKIQNLDPKNPCISKAPEETGDIAAKNCDKAKARASGATSGSSFNQSITAAQQAAQQAGQSSATQQAANQIGCVNLVKKYLDPLVKLLSALVGVFVAISLVVGGIQYSSSAGDPSKVTQAKKRIGEAIFALLDRGMSVGKPIYLAMKRDAFRNFLSKSFRYIFPFDKIANEVSNFYFSVFTRQKKVREKIHNYTKDTRLQALPHLSYDCC